MEDPHLLLPPLFEKYSIDATDVMCLKHLQGHALETFYMEYLSVLDAIRRYNEYRNDAERQVTIAKFKQEYKEPPKEKRIALTICPESHNTYHVLDKIVELIKSCTCVKGGKYVYEQRSEGDEPEYGWHIHLVVDSEYAPSKVKQFVQQKLKTKGINATYYATHADSKWETNYMEGQKFNDEKNKKVLKDAILREKYNLEKINILQ